MRVAREESFGPLAPLFRFSGEAEAIALANATEFGLAAYVYTRDLGRAWRVPVTTDARARSGVRGRQCRQVLAVQVLTAVPGALRTRASGRAQASLEPTRAVRRTRALE